MTITSNQQANQIVAAHFKESVRVKQLVVAECAKAIVSAGLLVADAFRKGNKLLLCGNGGSAADCQHIAAEFVSVLNQKNPRPALPAIALTTDTSFLTANANDFGFENVFARQIEALGAAGDVLIGISTSGNSPNVLRAFQVARQRQMSAIAMTGGTGGKLASMSDVTICIPSMITQHIQESHITAGHVLCDLVERDLFDGTRE